MGLKITNINKSLWKFSIGNFVLYNTMKLKITGYIYGADSLPIEEDKYIVKKLNAAYTSISRLNLDEGGKLCISDILKEL